MTPAKYLQCIAVFICLAATAIMLPDDQPQGALPAVHVPDKGCNSCHDIGDYK